MSLSSAPASPYAYLLTFEYGAGMSRVRRYARWARNIDVLDRRFVGVHEIGLQLPKIDGSAEDQPIVITMPLRLPIENPDEYPTFLTSLAAGEAHGKLAVTVEELDTSSTAAPRVIGWGILEKAFLNPGNERRLLRMEFGGVKARLRISLGMPCSAECVWQFGDPDTCRVAVADLRETVTAINAGTRFLQVTGLANRTAHHWSRGYAEFDGLRLLIRYYSGNTDILVLDQAAPEAWRGNTITLTPGCYKSLSWCRNKWNNELNFHGAGVWMPTRDPMTQAG